MFPATLFSVVSSLPHAISDLFADIWREAVMQDLRSEANSCYCSVWHNRNSGPAILLLFISCGVVIRLAGCTDESVMHPAARLQPCNARLDSPLPAGRWWPL